MGELIVAKAGGTSNATAEAVEQSLSWAETSDIFVVSAPGKLPGEGWESQKVTQLLLRAHQQYLEDGSVSPDVSDLVTERYAAIVRRLGSEVLSGYWIDSIRPRIEESVLHGQDAASLLGERLQAEIYAALGFKLLDPGRSPYDLGDEPDNWKLWLSGSFRQGSKHVLQGNTTRRHGQLATFDRGGSDITGGLAAYGISADRNLNLTDNCALSADPDLIPRTRLRPIVHMLYEEGRELGRNGTGLVHPAAMPPLMRGRIPTEIRSTFDMTQPPTILDSDYERAANRRGQIVALSMMRDVTMHRVHEPGMAEATGRLAAFDTALAEQSIPLIDSQGGGVDGQKYIVESRYAEAAKAVLEAAVRHGSVETKAGVDMITMVGHELHLRVVDNIFDLAFNSGLDAKRWQMQQHDLSLGRHSLRISVDPAISGQIFDRLHSHFLERDTGHAVER